MIEKVVVTMNYIKAFIQSESCRWDIILSAAILGVLVANSPMAEQYFATYANASWGPMDILEWVNDALMAFFFLYVGIEIKKEMISGELRYKAKTTTTCISCICRCCYTSYSIFLNCAGSMPEFRHGWGFQLLLISHLL